MTDQIEVNIDLMLSTEIPINVEIPVDQSVLVPFELGVQDYITLDTLIQVTDDIVVIVDDTIPLNQKVNVALLGGKGINVPINSIIPKENINIGFDELIPVHTTVPIDLVVIDTLPVGLDLKIPVAINLPVTIPIKLRKILMVHCL